MKHRKPTEPTEWSKNTDLNIQLTKETGGKKTKTGNVKHKEKDFNIKQEMKNTKTQGHDKNSNGTFFFFFDIKKIIWLFYYFVWENHCTTRDKLVYLDAFSSSFTFADLRHLSSSPLPTPSLSHPSSPPSSCWWAYEHTSFFPSAGCCLSLSLLLQLSLRAIFTQAWLNPPLSTTHPPPFYVLAMGRG